MRIRVRQKLRLATERQLGNGKTDPPQSGHRAKYVGAAKVVGGEVDLLAVETLPHVFLAEIQVADRPKQIVGDSPARFVELGALCFTGELFEIGPRPCCALISPSLTSRPVKNSNLNV